MLCKRSHLSRKPEHCKEEQLPLFTTRENPCAATNTQHDQKQTDKIFKRFPMELETCAGNLFNRSPPAHRQEAKARCREGTGRLLPVHSLAQCLPLPLRQCSFLKQQGTGFHGRLEKWTGLRRGWANQRTGWTRSQGAAAPKNSCERSCKLFLAEDT